MFVCTGNICRSAMAEHLLRHLASQRGLELEVRSCGIAAESWYEVPTVARRLLSEKGVPDFEHTPRLATRESLRWSDLVLVMTDAHRDHILERFPEFSARIKLLRDAAGFGEADVADPMGQSDEVFARCLSEIQESLEVLLQTGFRGTGA